MARKSADDRKAEIVATALRLADELGPDRLTTQAVADAVGLTQPAIFRHFPTKQALWQAVAEAIAQALTAAWDRALADYNPAIPAILHSHELQTENAQLRDQFRDLMQRFQGLLLAELTAGRDAGTFRTDLAPKDGAALLIALVQGVAIRWSLGNRGFALADEGARLLDAQLRVFMAPPETKENP